MTVEELTRKLESAEKQIIGLQDEIQNLKAKLDEANEIPDYPDFDCGIAWYMNDDLKTFKHETPKTENYNNFHTEGYAKYLAAKCREIAMLLHCKWHVDRDYVPDWNDVNVIKYTVQLHHDDKGEAEYTVENCFYSEYPTVYFSTYTAAQKAADWMNEHCFIHK